MFKSTKLGCHPACVRANTIDITPHSFPVALAGFGVGNEAHCADGPIEMNAALFGAADESLLVVSIDALFAGDTLIDWFSDALSLPRERITIAASHTHYAPAVDRTKPGLGSIDEHYQDQLKSAVAELCLRLKVMTPTPFRVRQGAAKTDAGVYRRLNWPFPHIGGRSKLIIPPGIENAPNFDVDIPNLVRSAVLEVQTQDGGTWEALAIIWSLACHPTRYHRPDVVSSDFVGAVRDSFRARYGARCPVLFMQGFSGDINPRPARRRPKFTPRSIIFGPRARRFGKAEWSDWARRIASHAIGALDGAANTALASEISLTRAAIPLTEIVAGAAARDVSVAHLRIASLNIVQVGAEVVSSYEACLPNDFWKAGCAGPVFGYWPSNIQAGEGGYEGGGYFGGFGLTGTLRPEPETAFAHLMKLIGLCEAKA